VLAAATRVAQVCRDNVYAKQINMVIVICLYDVFWRWIV